MRPKTEQNDETDDRHLHAELDEIAEGEECGEDSAEEVDDSGADEIADAFDVGHDASDEGAGAVGVVEGYWEPADVSLDLHAQLGDEALTFFGKKLGERVGGDALNDGGEKNRADDPGEQCEVLAVHDLVDKGLGRGRKDEAAGAIDDHQKEASG